MVRQIGLDADVIARAMAAQPVAEPYVASPPVLGASVPAMERDSIGAWAGDLFDTIWNGRRFDRLGRFYAAAAIVHSGGGRTVQGLPALSGLLLSILAAMPDGILMVKNVCWSNETDGVIVAVRWVLAGSSSRGGILGDALPEGRPVFMMGSSHLRLGGSHIVEEWTVFDEIAVMAMAWRE